MAIKIDKWKDGFVHPCTVTVEPRAELKANGMTDCDIVIRDGDEIIAQGWCIVPSAIAREVADSHQPINVRFTAATNHLGSTAICAADFEVNGQWVGELIDAGSDTRGELLNSL